MHITAKATGSVELTPELREYIEKKAAMLEKYLGADNDDTAHCEVEVGKMSEGFHSGDVYRVALNVSHTGVLRRYEASSKDVFKAIDKAKDEMKRELQRMHKKEQHVFKRGAQAMKRFLRGG